MSTKISMAAAAAATLMVGGSAMAGLETVMVDFTIEFTTDMLGPVTLSDTFEATETTEGGVTVIAFGGSGSFDLSAAGFTLDYSDLDVVFGGEFIDGNSNAQLMGPGTDMNYMFELTGFGDLWNGSSASGVGVVYLSSNGFVPESYSASWSITQVPTPGAVALLGVAGLAGRRRRN